jgi:hypothetical protein
MLGLTLMPIGFLMPWIVMPHFGPEPEFEPELLQT